MKGQIKRSFLAIDELLKKYSSRGENCYLLINGPQHKKMTPTNWPKRRVEQFGFHIYMFRKNATEKTNIKWLSVRNPTLDQKDV